METDASADCDPFAPPVTLPLGTFVIFSHHKSLHTKEAFWALPFHSHGAIGAFDLHWKLIVQRVLWLTGHKLMVHSANMNVIQETQSAEMFALKYILMDWTCKSKFVRCLMDLTDILVQKKFLDKAFRDVLDVWISTLKTIGYRFPVTVSNATVTCPTRGVAFEPVRFPHPADRSETAGNPRLPVDHFADLHVTYRNTCMHVRPRPDATIHFMQPWTQFKNVLLLVVYNNAFYLNIPYVEALYRPFFPHMVHCGPGVGKIRVPYFRQNHFSFIPYKRTKVGHVQGAHNYECITNAVRMHFPVEGYLVMSDDLLFSVSKIAHNDLNKVWYMPKNKMHLADVTTMKECHQHQGKCDSDPSWMWWKIYKNQTLNLLKRMENAPKDSVLGQCFRTLVTRNGGDHRLNGLVSDMFYIPKRIAPQFATLASEFLQEDIFLEIAVPTILQCIEGLNKVTSLLGMYVWGNDRNSPWLSLTKQHFDGYSGQFVYLHPTKWSSLITNKNKELRKFFCRTALPWLHNPQGTLPG